MAFSQSHPGTSAVLVDELDASYFECPTNRLEGRAAWLARACFELMHGHYSHLSVVRECLLAPFQEAARCPAL
jgi:hypothetical protein